METTTTATTTIEQESLSLDSINILIERCGFEALLEILNDIEPELAGILNKEFEHCQLNVS
jgi:hypothetical protein